MSRSSLRVQIVAVAARLHSTFYASVLLAPAAVASFFVSASRWVNAVTTAGAATNLSARFSAVNTTAGGRRRGGIARTPFTSADLRLRFLLALTVAMLATPALAHSYIGPGAGFALISSFLTFIIAFFTAFFAIFTLPIRMLWRSWRRKKPEGKRKAEKVIILGLDGMEPTITEKMLEDGQLPNMAKLKAEGTYRRLGTSTPAMSPVAWSSFATGSDASRHGIFDFLSRDPRTYLPVLSSSNVYGASKFLSLGPFKIPLKKGGVRFLRKSISFWKVLSDYGIFSTILRVPITFPPEKINGVVLAGMDVPDLRGTMGSFTYYTQSPDDDKIGGLVIRLSKNGNVMKTSIPGPPSPVGGKTIEVPIEIERKPEKDGVELRVSGEKIFLKEREYSPWVRLTFKAAPNLKFSGIVRFYVTRLNGDFGMYVTPIHIDPDKPAMPLSSPPYYAMYLAKLFGSYGTLGLAEDTWAINERILDEDGFLEQAYLLHEERKKMWFHSLDKLRKGVVCCVFDISDRLQHICFRYLDVNHPANAGKDVSKHKSALFDMYRKMDELVGETMKYKDDDTALFVISDHGFKTFQRGVNINTWLRDHGYLKLKEDYKGDEYLRGVDWSQTKAYAIGLGGIFLNIKGRESQGIVDPEDRAAVKKEIANKLLQLIDTKNGKEAINSIYDVENDFTGPYRKDGPDMMVGFAEGYRVSWDCAQGIVTDMVIEDNTKSWSGDHCMDPEICPGILFTNLKVDNENPSLMDMAPTVLDLFGINAPAFMTGRSLVHTSAPTNIVKPRAPEPEAAVEQS